MSMRSLIPAAAVAIALSACSSHRQSGTPAGEAGGHGGVVVGTAPDRGTSSVHMLPRARLYRTSAPSDSLVPVTLSPSGDALVSYPAPGDLTSVPPRLTDGWMLDTRGITPSTAFTRYTYAEYKALPSAPTPSELLGAIVPGLTVTEIVELPVSVGSATPAMADSLISRGLPGCKTIFNL